MTGVFLCCGSGGCDTIWDEGGSGENYVVRRR